MFLQDNFIFRPQLFSLPDDASLSEARVIETCDIQELVAFLEVEFRIRIARSEINSTYLDSIKAIIGFVEGKLAKSVA